MDQTQNSFLEGIIGDRTPLDSDPKSVTDAVNATVFSNKGDQLAERIMKSTTPVVNPGAYESVEYEASISGDRNYNISLNAVYNKFQFRWDPRPITGGASLLIEVIYEDDSIQTIWNTDWNGTFPAGRETHSFELDGSQKVKTIRIPSITRDRTTQPVLYIELIQYQEGFVGMPAENKVLGVKTFNDVAYIVSGKPVSTLLQAENKGHTQTTIFDIYREKTSIQPRRIPPDRYTTQIIEDDRYREVLIDKTKFINKKVGWFWAGPDHTSASKSEYVHTTDISGEYSFELSARVYIPDAGIVNWRWVEGKIYIKDQYDNILAASVLKSTEGRKEFNKSIEFNQNLTSGTQLTIVAEVEGAAEYGWHLCTDVSFIKTNGPIKVDTSGAHITNFTDGVSKTLPKSDLGLGGSFSFSDPCTSIINTQPYWYVKIDSGEYMQVNAGEVFDSANYNFGADVNWPTTEGLPAGSYNVTVFYVGDNTGTYGYYTRTEVITLGESEKVNPLEIKARVLGFKSLDDPFDLEISVLDERTPTTYNVWYELQYRDEEGQVQTIPSAKVNIPAGTHVFTVPPINVEATLNIYAEEVDKHSLINVPTELAAADDVKRKTSTSLYLHGKLIHQKYNVEIGTFPSPSYTEEKGELVPKYTSLHNYNSSQFIANELFLTGDHYLDMEIQQVYDGTVNILYTEPGFDQRCINSGFSILPDNKYELRLEGSSKSINRYSSNNIDTKTRLIQRAQVIPEFILNQIPSSGGDLEVGTYQYYIKLGTKNGNETGILGETGLIPIFHGDTLGTIKGGKAGDRTQRSIEFKLKNIDSGFDFVSLYYIHNTGDDRLVSQAFKVDKQYTLPESEGTIVHEFTITHTGFEPSIQIPESELSEIKDYYSSIRTLTQVQDRLFLGNLNAFNIDYNKLFEIGKRICVTPSSKTNYGLLSGYEEFWGNSNLWSLNMYGNHLFSKQISAETAVPDVNFPVKALDNKHFYNILNNQGLKNPLFASQYIPYWPMETYKFGVCFVLEGEIVTKPIPILGGDFSNYVGYTNYGTEENVFYYYNRDNDTELSALAEKIKNVMDSTYGVTWKRLEGEGASPTQVQDSESADLNVNNMGIIRFPKRITTNQPLFPKFHFDLDELKALYPELFAKIKGMFFVRTERKPDALMEGVTLGTKMVPTDERIVTGTGWAAEDIIDSPNDTYSAVPIIQKYDETFALTDQFMVTGYYDTTNSTNSKSLVQPSTITLDKQTYLDNLSNGSDNLLDTGIASSHKWSFYSPDLIPLHERAAASFKGQSFGIQQSSWVVPYVDGMSLEGSTTGYASNRHVLALFGRPMENISGELVNGDFAGKGTPCKVIGDYIASGTSVRSGAGFASAIPFRRGYFKHTLDGDAEPTELAPTGNFSHFIGLVAQTADHKFNGRIGMLYSSITGPMSVSALRSSYSTDELTSFKAVTPVYKIEDVERYMKKGVLGTRGDNLMSTTFTNVVKTPPALGPNPTSTNPESYDENNINSEYLAGEASINMNHILASNYFNYARHNEVTDEVESALYGKARSFLPLMNAADSKLYEDHYSKLPESKAINKGYTAAHTGRLLYNVSADTPFVNTIGSNTITYSEKTQVNSTYNGFRDFYAGNNQDYNKELGAVTKLVNYYNNLLAVHKKGVTLLGVNDQTLVGQNTGGDVLTNSKSVLNPKAKILSNTVGSGWLRSVCPTDNSVYGVDVDDFKIWAVQGDQLNIISAGKVNRLLAGILKDFKGKSEIPGERYIATHYDKMKGDVIFTFYNKDSRYTQFPLPMDVDEYYMVADMVDDEARQAWIRVPLEDLTEDTPQEKAITIKEKVLRRNRIYNQYKRIAKNYEVTNHITLVYNEQSQTWVTRLSKSPEFAFNLRNSFYSINNKVDAGDFEQVLEPYKDRALIWDHNAVHPEFHSYGSMYGADPVFEVEFVVNAAPQYKKLFKSLSVLGNEARPSKLIYTLPDSCPWLNVLKEVRYHSDNGYQTWEDLKEAYLNKLNESDASYPVVNPFALIEQIIYDRKHSPIYKANYQFQNTNNIISIGKNMNPLYWEFNGDDRRDMSMNFADKWIKIRLRYTSGEYVYIKQILTDYNIYY